MGLQLSEKLRKPVLETEAAAYASDCVDPLVATEQNSDESDSVAARPRFETQPLQGMTASDELCTLDDLSKQIRLASKKKRDIKVFGSFYDTKYRGTKYFNFPSLVTQIKEDRMVASSTLPQISPTNESRRQNNSQLSDYQPKAHTRNTSLINSRNKLDFHFVPGHDTSKQKRSI